MSKTKKLKRTGQTAERVFRRLIETILSGELPCGQAIPEARLAREWKVSRTPMREAMRRTAESGFILLRSNQMPIVRRLSPEEVRDLYELRQVLEVRALELSWGSITPVQIGSLRQLAAQVRPSQARGWVRRCLELDRALHRLWTHQCGNSWLIKDIEHHYRFLRIFQRWIARNPEALAAAYQQHLGIMGAIEAADKAGAMALLRDHICASARMVQQILSDSKTAGQPPPV
jgi:DNA-binding GntR family transcriptional regulator